MEGSLFQESKFFAAIAASGARALLIGRRALVVLGLPVLTRDYDYWLHADAKVTIPSLNDLILTKRFGARPKDAEDIRMLEVLRSQDPAGEEPQG